MISYTRVHDEHDDSAGRADGDRELVIDPLEVSPVSQHSIAGSPSTPPIDLNVPGALGSISSTQGRQVVVVLPYVTILLVLSAVTVFLLSDSHGCSQPLTGWIVGYLIRHVSKSLLEDLRAGYISLGQLLPRSLLLALACVDLASPSLWVLGGHYILHTTTCNDTLYVYACCLWTLQSISLLLPCCFLSTFIICAPCVIWLAPYFIKPNPNTIATSREVMARIPKVEFQSVESKSYDSGCSICIAEYTPTDEVMQLPCGHIFHAKCIEDWLKLSQLCPVDRINVATSLNDPHFHNPPQTTRVGVPTAPNTLPGQEDSLV